MTRAEPVKVIFVTPLWDRPRTGPEVYAKYLWESFRDDPDIEFHLVAGGEGEAHPRLHLVKPPGGSLSLYKAVAHKALELAHRLGPRGILHVNNSNFHHSLLRSPWPIIGQINDYEAAQFRAYDVTALRRHGLRRFLALWRRHFLERKFVRSQALTLCNSDFTRRQICAAYGVAGPNIRVAYKSVDVERFIPPPSAARTPDRGRKTVIFVGTNFYIKGLDVLVRAMGMVGRRARLVVVGVEAPGFEQRFPGLLDSARGDGAQFEFLGPVSRAEIPALLWSADLFCLPSRSEALGVALLEGVAAGLPCVATEVGGIPEIARHFSGVRLVPPEDPASLAIAIEQGLDKDCLPVKIDDIRRHFGRESMVRDLKQSYLNLLS